jgi:hypothetical protein
MGRSYSSKKRRPPRRRPAFDCVSAQMGADNVPMHVDQPGASGVEEQIDRLRLSHPQSRAKARRQCPGGAPCARRYPNFRDPRFVVGNATSRRTWPTWPGPAAVATWLRSRWGGTGKGPRDIGHYGVARPLMAGAVLRQPSAALFYASAVNSALCGFRFSPSARTTEAAPYLS